MQERLKIKLRMPKKLIMALLLLLAVSFLGILTTAPTVYAAENASVITFDEQDYYGTKAKELFGVTGNSYTMKATDSFQFTQNSATFKFNNQTYGTGSDWDGWYFNLHNVIITFDEQDYYGTKAKELFGVTGNSYTMKATDSFQFTQNSATFKFNNQTYGTGSDWDGWYFNITAKKTTDYSRPAINGQENFVTNVDDPKPISFFQSYLTAYDETDGDLTSKIVVKSDGYTTNKDKLGKYEVVFSVKDNSNNEATLLVFIHVVDTTPPVINGTSTIATIGYKETWNITAFKNTLTVTDNYDPSIPTSSITVKSDGYTSNKSKIGTYSIVYAVKDSSNNEGTFIKQVQVIDNIKPTFTGPKTIATSNTSVLTESDVRSQLTANDEIDGNLTNAIKLVSDNYTGNGNTVGSYTIVYEVTDASGNKATHTVTIVRSDKLPPVFMIKDGVSILVDKDTPLTKEQIIQILTATGQLTVNATTQVLVTYDEYTGNESVPGIYAYSLMAKDTKGNEEVFNLAINVLNETDDGGTIIEPEPSWFEKNKTFLAVSGILIVGAIGFIIIKKRS